MAPSPICSIPNCGKPVLARGWCRSHYERWKRHGEPLAGRRARPPRGSARRFLRETVLRFTGDECLTWPYSQATGGYGQVRDSGRMRRVHVVVCEAVYGPRPSPKHEAAHSCGKGHKQCVNPNHLRWATHAENQADKIKHGTACRGETSHASKLTTADVRRIRALRGQIGSEQLGRMFGVNGSSIVAIQRRRSWAWLD